MSRLDPECYGDEYASLARSTERSAKDILPGHTTEDLVAELKRRMPCIRCSRNGGPTCCDCSWNGVLVLTRKDLFKEKKWKD